MRLICPECNALYDIPDEMIPPEGREVECSACGHVWMQALAVQTAAPPVPPPAEEPAREQPRSHTMRGLSEDLRAAARPARDVPLDLGAAPVLQRPLPDDVLSILREETARELGVRRGGKQAAPEAPVPEAVAPEIAAPEAHEPEASAPQPVPAPAAQAESPPPASRLVDEPAAQPSPAAPVADDPAPPESDSDWPATTVTAEDIGPRPESPQPAATAPFRRRAEAAPAARDPAPRPETPRSVAPQPRRPQPRELPDVDQLAATLLTEMPPPAEVPPAPPPPAPASGYRAGMGRALSVSAALLVAYVACAGWVGTGQAPAPVASLVAGVDAARAGLQDAAQTLFGPETE